MKGYDSLIKLNRWRVDEKRRSLTELEQLEHDLTLRLDQLDAQFRAEQEAARSAAVVAFDYAAYADTMRQRRATGWRDAERLGTMAPSNDRRINDD